MKDGIISPWQLELEELEVSQKILFSQHKEDLSRRLDEADKKTRSMVEKTLKMAQEKLDEEFQSFSKKCLDEQTAHRKHWDEQIDLAGQKDIGKELDSIMRELLGKRSEP